MIFIVPPVKGGNGPQGPKCPHDCSVLCSTLCSMLCLKDCAMLYPYILIP